MKSAWKKPAKPSSPQRRIQDDDHIKLFDLNESSNHSSSLNITSFLNRLDLDVNFNVRPWVKSGDYWAVKFDFTEKVKLTFDEKKIGIPYPQMDVHLDKTA